MNVPTTKRRKATNQTNMSAPNLTQLAPRSPRVRLGGYTILPRVLDKAPAFPFRPDSVTPVTSCLD